MLKQSQQIADVLDFQGCQEAAKPLVLSETGNIASDGYMAWGILRSYPLTQKCAINVISLYGTCSFQTYSCPKQRTKCSVIALTW